jgi:hypothetical protein
MEAKDAIAKLKTDLAAARTEGRKTVQIEALEEYLAALEKESGTSIEEQKLELQRSLAHYDAVNKSNLEMFRSVIESGKEALNASLLINGGAVIAVLSFLGTAVGKGASNALGLALTYPLLAFGSGVLLAALAFAARYFTQYAYDREAMRPGTGFHILTVLLGLSAYSSFGFGVFLAYRAFGAHFGGAA